MEVLVKRSPCLSIATLISITLLCPLTISAQFVSSTIWLDIRDDTGGHDSLVFGTHQFATYCIDTALGEGPAAEYPPGGFIAAFQSIPSRENCFGTPGIIHKDLREFSSETKKDTFYIDYTSLDSAGQVPGAKSTLRWPDSAYLTQRCDSMFLQDREGGLVFTGRIDMFAQSSLSVNLPDDRGPNIYWPTIRLKIFRYGVHQPYVDGIHEDKRQIPDRAALLQNYPDPFNPSTKITYSVAKHTRVRLQVFNLLGQAMKTLVDQDEQPGVYTATWEANGEASGVYFYRMTAGEFVQTKKAILIR